MTRVIAHLAITERAVGIMIFSRELGFLKRPYRDHLRSAAGSEPSNTSYLQSCLDTSKKFFEYILSLPETSYLNFTYLQWAGMVHGVLVLSRLTFVMASNLGWDSETARSTIPLSMYLDALCYRFQALSPTASDPSDKPKNADVLYMFKKILGSVKSSYEKRLSKIEPGFLVVDQNHVIDVTARGRCPIFDPNLRPLFELSDSTYGGSFGLNEDQSPSDSTTAALNPPPHFFDIWATMTGSWAEEF